MKKLALLIPIFLFVISVNANVFIKAGVGYGLGNQKYLLDQVFTATATENIYGSFGGNLGLHAGIGVDINEHMELGADLGYQHGRSIEAFSTFFNKTFTGRLLYLNPTLTYKTELENDFTPYAKVGILTGFAIMNLDVNGDIKKCRGGIPLVATGAIGLNYNISDYIKLFAEIQNQTMLYKPTKRKESGGGTVIFTDVLENNAPITTEIHHHFFSYGALGLNLGLKIIL